ncbi:CUE domain-containing protein 3 [Cyphellophora attinorum]|uniref:CUE domain-containing protein 3 n=1 Tax=Cyphellophora attinorum TaxID=1664694 RepID=A0A0N0NQU9_9EURO|nr:CUE domain-containing protein 3 [Phialophora attinorum]KPI44338.1 CUE domain-containing protein 3 [Phialophora attinorum]
MADDERLKRPLIAFPNIQTWKSLPPDEWQACLDVWLLGLEYRLRLSDDVFRTLEASFGQSDLDFVKSYLKARPEQAKLEPGSKEARVHQRTYFLLRRLLLGTQIIVDGGSQLFIDIVIGSSSTFNVSDFPRLVAAIAKQYPKQFSAGIESWKINGIKRFTSRSNEPESMHALQEISGLLRANPESGLKLMAGADYLEAVMELYRNLTTSSEADTHRRIIVEHLFQCLRSLMSDKTRHPALLIDQLYVMRTDADQLGAKKAEIRTLLSELVCTTNFLRHLAGDPAVMDTKRGQDMLDALMAYREQTRQLFPVPPRRKRQVDKGKRKADHSEEMHIHQAAQVSQINELFPDLPAAYIMRLLDHFSNDVEMTTAALLEPASLPPHLQDATAETPELPVAQPSQAKTKAIPSHVPKRQNKFDNDDFDRLQISPRQLHKGRRKVDLDGSLPDEENRRKAATLAALAAFETDDDEADDTYNEVDVGGSVDQSVDTDERKGQFEEILYAAWRGNTTIFARDSKTRISPVRQDLKRQTGMSDEQIEGWAIMLARDPAMQRRLQQKYSAVNTFRGNQRKVDSTSWRGSASAENSMDESDDHKVDTGDENAGSGGVSPSNKVEDGVEEDERITIDVRAEHGKWGVAWEVLHHERRLLQSRSI